MRRRTPEEIKAYADGYNDCYSQFISCLKGRRSVMDAIRKMQTYVAAVNNCVTGGEEDTDE